MLDQNDQTLVTSVLELGDRLSSSHSQTTRHTVVAGLRTKSNRQYFGVNCDGIHGTCAEVVAYANAVLAADTEVETVVAALISARDGERILSPCGNCRQVFLDLAPDISVVISTDGGLKKISIAEMLPYPYRHGATAEKP